MIVSLQTREAGNAQCGSCYRVQWQMNWPRRCGIGPGEDDHTTRCGVERCSDCLEEHAVNWHGSPDLKEAKP